MVASNIDLSNASPDLAELVNRATDSQEIITLTNQGKKSAVLISAEAFEHLVGIQKYRQTELMPPDEFEQQFHQALVEAGYDSREKIIDLVREVKQEIYEEHNQPR
jgi:prevent-host-death family protein